MKTTFDDNLDALYYATCKAIPSNWVNDLITKFENSPYSLWIVWGLVTVLFLINVYLIF